MPKYNLVDEKSDGVIGFAVINSEVMTEFQSVAGAAPASGGALSASGPLAEAGLFVVVLGASSAMVLVANGPGWLSAVVGIGSGLIVASVRAWRSGVPDTDKIPEAEVVVRGEFKSIEGTIHYDEITDRKIKLRSLQAVSRAVINNGFEWMGRPTMMVKAGISRGQYDLIRAQFQQLNYFRDGEGNKVEMSSRGRLFVRKVFEFDRRRNNT